MKWPEPESLKNLMMANVWSNHHDDWWCDADKLMNSTGRDLRRALFSLKQMFQDDKSLVHEFVQNDGLACLIKVGSEADQNYQNYILRGETTFFFPFLFRLPFESLFLIPQLFVLLIGKWKELLMSGSFSLFKIPKELLYCIHHIQGSIPCLFSWSFFPLSFHPLFTTHPHPSIYFMSFLLLIIIFTLTLHTKHKPITSITTITATHRRGY